MGFLASCWNDDERTDQFSVSSLGLIGDFGDTYESSVRDVLMQEWVQGAISYGRQRGASKQARTNAAYAQKVRILFGFSETNLMIATGYQGLDQIDVSSLKPFRVHCFYLHKVRSDIIPFIIMACRALPSEDEHRR